MRSLKNLLSLTAIAKGYSATRGRVKGNYVGRVLPVATAIMICFGVAGHQRITELRHLAKEAESENNYERAAGFYDDLLKYSETLPDSAVKAEGSFYAHSGLRDALLELERYDEAIKHGEWCVESFRNNPNFKREDASLSYAMLGSVWSYAGDPEKAFCYVDSAMNLLGDDSPVEYQRAIPGMLGIVASHTGNWVMAERAYRYALEAERKRPLSDEYISTLNLLANSIYQQDRYEEALNLYNEQLEKSREYFGPDADETLKANYQLTNVLAFSGDIPGACEKYIEVAGEYTDKLRRKIRVLPEGKREAFLGGCVRVLRGMTSFGVAAGVNNDKFTETAYNGILTTKGLLLQSDKSVDRILRRYGSRTDINRLDSLRILQKELTALEAERPDDRSAIARTYAEVLRLDSLTIKACSGHGNPADFLETDYKKIISVLPERETVVDFMDYDSPRGHRYMAYVYSGGQPHPVRVPVFFEAQLDSLLALENNLESNLYSGESNEALRSIVFEPLREYIPAGNKVWFVPSGSLHKIAVEAIEDTDGLLLADKYEISRLMSAREILSQDVIPADSRSKMSALLVGGLTYQDPLFKTLPGSVKEINELCRLEDLDPVVLRDADACVEDIKSVSGDSPEVVHFSTHGFFYTGEESDLPQTMKGYTDAMYLCGLQLSNGALYGHDISEMDMTQTKLLSLASCDTGRGKVTPEGLYGLQRAFKRAGCGSMLMSLWEVSDAAGNMFVREFYKTLTSDPQHDSRRAWKTARDKVRARYPHPFYWANFIIIR